jgi:hypothetical protein
MAADVMRTETKDKAGADKARGWQKRISTSAVCRGHITGGRNLNGGILACELWRRPADRIQPEQETRSRKPLHAQKKLKKDIAFDCSCDNLPAPLRPKGRKDSMFADR